MSAEQLPMYRAQELTHRLFLVGFNPVDQVQVSGLHEHQCSVNLIRFHLQNSVSIALQQRTLRRVAAPGEQGWSEQWRPCRSSWAKPSVLLT